MMKTPTILTLSTLLTLLPPTLAQCTDPVPCKDESLNALNTTDCQTYHAFIARGSDSGYPGHLGPLAKLFCANLTSSNPSSTCGYENIIYPANSSWSGSETIWCESAAIGAKNGQKQLREYAQRCPDAKLILLGFSQGASVGLDILGGGGGKVFNCTQDDNDAMDPSTSPGSHIIAATVFGAVHRTAHQSYQYPNDGQNFNGTNPRNSTQLSALNKYSHILREYCNPGDPICAPESPGQAVENHLSYFEKYNQDAMDFIVGKAMSAGNATNGGNGTESGGSIETNSNVQSGGEAGGEKGDEKSGAAGFGGAFGALSWGMVLGVVVLVL